MLCLRRKRGEELDIQGTIVRVCRIDRHAGRSLTITADKQKITDNGMTVTLEASGQRKTLVVGDMFTIHDGDRSFSIMLCKHFGNAVELGIDAPREMTVRRRETVGRCV